MPIVVENVSYTYNPGSPHQWQALDNVNVTLGDGEFWGLIGATGSGKSTLVQQLNGLLKPTSGRVLVDGVDTKPRGTDLRAIRQQVGLVFQYPEHQLFAATVHEEVSYGPRNLGLGADDVEERVRWALAAVGLSTDMLNRSPFGLSGGQARRLALAGVLAMKPRTLVLDEPAAGLDPVGRREMLRLIRDLHRSGMTVLLVSHSMEDVAELAQHVLVLHRGKVAMQGAARDLFRRHADLAALDLAAPPAARLVDRLKEKGWALPGRAVTTAEAVAEVAAALKARRKPTRVSERGVGGRGPESAGGDRPVAEGGRGSGPHDNG